MARKKRLPASERRELILAAAKKLFSASGYAATSIDDIAAAAGVTKPVVYDHFSSKQSLYFALMRRLRDELLGAAAASLSSAAATPRDRFHRAIETFFQQVKRDPAIVSVLFVQSRTEPDLSREWGRLQAEAMANLKPLARALAPGLHPWQLDVAVSFLHHGLNASAEAWPRSASPAEMADLIVTLMWRGLESVSES